MSTLIFRSAITNEDGTVNVGYLVLMRLLQFDSLLSAAMIAAGFWMQYSSPTHEYPFMGVATALGAIWGTFTTTLAAMGAFLWADSKTPQTGGTPRLSIATEADHVTPK